MARASRRESTRSWQPPGKSATALDDAWRAAEKRFADTAGPRTPRQSRPRPGRPEGAGRRCSGKRSRGPTPKTGGWAWLRYPPRTPDSRKPRTLWLTRTPQKTFAGHGRELLANATLRPLDSVLSAIRAHVPSAAPGPSCPGIEQSGAAVRPSVLSSELAVYLLRHNHGLRTRPPPTVPAHAMGLALPEGERPDSEDPADLAWNFRLGLTQARWITRWRSQKGATGGG